ncbi:MAG TPA: FMN-binding protein [bacterium]|nr:FMN-binding protein [bacterium]
MKKTLIIIAVVLVVLIAGGAIFFKVSLMKMNEEIDREFASMPQIDVASIPDGVYSAQWGRFVVKADLDVVVSGGVIEKINIKKMESGKGYEGLEIIDRIIGSQKLKVDAVTGATYSSKVIMITTAKALERK